MPRLLPPEDGVTIRMYRIGHGDCFLLAFAGEDPQEPAYVLIDCGYKPGSPGFINTHVNEVVADIKEATGGNLHVAVLTHEHQDHLNGITETRFNGIEIDELWLPWTEDPNDALANELREEFDDFLLQLVGARQRLAADGDEAQVASLDQFLTTEFGGEGPGFDALAAGSNKTSMKVFKDKARRIRFLHPHEDSLAVPQAKDVNAFPLGSPRDRELLGSMDPENGEAFPRNHFGFALGQLSKDTPERPFGRADTIEWEAGLNEEFFAQHYSDSEWRRIDKDWLQSAEVLAMDMNRLTNNSSLALAFELGAGGKVLLFAADAQRGNWISWGDARGWRHGSRTVQAKDLLARTVLYKVGHHGSHNATLNGTRKDDFPNLAWMAQGALRKEFTAMITAVRDWALQQTPIWDHPLPSIKAELEEMTAGRVFQTDTTLDLAAGQGPDWDDFVERSKVERLYFEHVVRR